MEDSDIWSLPPLTLRVWVWLLLHVNTDAKEWRGMSIEPGELITSYAHIAKGVAWTENRARREPSIKSLRCVLKRLEMGQALRQEPRQGGIWIKVLHWEEYQGKGATTRAGTRAGTRAELGQDRGNHLRIKKEEDITFVRFWDLYPRQVARSAALKKWDSVTKTTPAEEIIEGLKAQLPELRSRELTYIPHASTWLNQERWKDRVPKPKSALELIDEEWGGGAE
jgi:hypothetical protein